MINRKDVARPHKSVVALVTVFGCFSSSVVLAQSIAASDGGNKSTSDMKSVFDAVSQQPSPVPSLFGSPAGAAVNQAMATPSYDLGGGSTPPTQGGVRLENGVVVKPSVSVGYSRNDNVTNSATNKISSDVLVVRPKLAAELQYKTNMFKLAYGGGYTEYRSSSTDNVMAHDLQLDGISSPTGRTTLKYGAGYTKGTDARGAVPGQTASETEPRQWHATSVRLGAGYGAPGATGRLEFDSSLVAKRYDNLRSATAILDSDVLNTTGRFLYRVMPKTSAVFELGNSKTNYVANLIPNRDNTENRYALGLTWDATAKTSGTVKLGQARREYDDASMPTAKGANWSASVQWAPLTYSVFDLQTARQFADSTGVGNYMVNRNWNLGWNHAWSSAYSSRLSYGIVNTIFSGTSPIREDDIETYGFGIFYNLNATTRVGFDLNHSKRDSSNPANNYKRNISMVQLEVGL